MTDARMAELMLTWVNQRVKWLMNTIPDGEYLQGQVSAYLQIAGLLQFFVDDPRRSGRSLSCASPEGTGGGEPRRSGYAPR